MLRQTLSLLLSIALLSSQAVACCGHAHPGHANDSTQRAHVHLHGHAHGQQGKHHHGHASHDHFPVAGNAATTLVAADSFEHDSDAIYLGEPDPLLLTPGHTVAMKSPCCSCLPVILLYSFPRSDSHLLECSRPRFALAHALILQTGRLLL
jgi:hypothetical protein